MHSYTFRLFQAYNYVWQSSVKHTDIKKIYLTATELPYMKGDNRNTGIRKQK